MRVFCAYFTSRLASLSILVLIALHAHASTTLESSSNIPAPLQEVGFDQNLDQQVPLDLSFKDETGKAVRLSDYLGKRPAILVLAYYECPHLCTLVLNGVAKSALQIGLKLGGDYSVITVSINPKETPQLATAKKASYMRLLGKDADPKGWHFLTGTQDSISRLAKAVGFRYKYESESGQYAHASGIMVMTPKGKLSHYFFGIEFPARDLRLALVAASNGKIGSAVDQLLLFCCDYDPVTGKYDLVINRMVKVVCLGVAGLLVLYILVMFWTERWRSRAQLEKAGA